LWQLRYKADDYAHACGDHIADLKCDGDVVQPLVSSA
jgi:hypothetical protein